MKQKQKDRQSHVVRNKDVFTSEGRVQFSGTLHVSFKGCALVLAGWLSWLEHCPMHQKVVGLIPS